jgi:hypothetical protein
MGWKLAVMWVPQRVATKVSNLVAYSVGLKVAESVLNLVVLLVA